MVRRTYVALDIETTGLDLEQDRITEVGAVRFDDDGREIETFQTLVNPGRQIPRFIEQLTGVTNEAVASAPTIDVVSGSISAFLGGDVVVGQNIGFDLARLRKAGVVIGAAALDTAELSRLLLPGRQARGLVDLAAALGVEAADHHRALPDARTAAAVFVALKRQAAALDPGLRLQLARLVSLSDLALSEVIAGETWRDLPAGERALPTVRPAAAYPSLTKVEPLTPTRPEAVTAVFAAARRVFDGYEERTEQAEMAEAVRSAMSDGGHWMVEAGTGVGKSLAYLVPAALHALANGERVVISTNTINLQEQLFRKDIPALRKMLVAAGVIQSEGDLRASILKGRSNYLCLRRWTASYAANLGDPDFSRLAAAMLLWLPETETGDRAELNFDHNDWLTWQRFSAQDADCLGRPNAFVKEGNCFLQRARKTAESAHIIIANHALLLADVASGGSALPPYDYLVIDEAHNLEDQATQQFGGSVSRRQLAEALEQVHRPRRGDQREGGVVTLLKAFEPGAARMAGEALEATVATANRSLGPFFEGLAAFLGRSEDDRVLLDRSLRAQPGWIVPEKAWGELNRALIAVQSRAAYAAKTVIDSAPVEAPDAIAAEIETAARKAEDSRTLLDRILGAHDDATITWLARERDGTASVNAAPLDVGPTLWESLFMKKRTVVATSATLSAAGSMEYTARRLGLEGPRTLQLGSPFDYERATLLTAFTDIPEPNDAAYLDAVTAAIVKLVRASNGRALALFTSHAALKRVAERARPELERAGIAVLAQGVDGTPRQLTDALVREPRTAIFGTSSFWEGVDIRGEALSMLIIARLPFSVPTDPVYRARSEQYENPFGQYSLPSAILKFRQGFGRLIRDREDRGVVAVLDRRIYEKRYGDDFIAALPRCTRFRGDMEAVAGRAREWLAP